MTRKNKLSKIRRSRVLEYGPGSIIDFLPENSGPVSVIAGGLDYWNEFSKGNGNTVDWFARPTALTAIMPEAHFAGVFRYAAKSINSDCHRTGLDRILASIVIWPSGFNSHHH